MRTSWKTADEGVRDIELSGGAGFQGLVSSSYAAGLGLGLAQRSVKDGDLDWHHDRIPKPMAEQRLTSISGVEMP